MQRFAYCSTNQKKAAPWWPGCVDDVFPEQEICTVERELSLLASALTARRFNLNYAGSRQRNRPDGENWSVSVRPKAWRERHGTAAGLGGNSPRNDSSAPQDHCSGPVEQCRCFKLMLINLQLNTLIRGVRPVSKKACSAAGKCGLYLNPL